eukprot:CAMPEP_0170530072 /NCGR_PEP_ID=MMETSP0209-20121228/40564_1 /TAXON_ID=665100 ORGANISM="Litonotus pictus, Strain P1" /NCGR_SAMPLE_ID=MMETSP0209 /ASSEMBLY_ACC=CAM_ASM_000301 /LENGTH=73 /DNA_ID=CAMNT_0010822781 /DNA_START=24 /DNA_END=241 /DNA_ORIENTATION=+
MAMFNIFTNVLFYQYENEGKNVIGNKEDFNSIITTMVPLGAFLGAFTGGPLSSIGRLKAIFILNVVIVIGSGV